MSQRARIPTGLPNLPGNTFYDVRVQNFSKPQTLQKHVTGFQDVRDVPEFARTVTASSSGSAPTSASGARASADASTPLAGTVRASVLAPPSAALASSSSTFSPSGPPPNLQGKMLIFHSYFLETVHESAVEQFRVRPCRFLYYLEDDTMEVIERAQPNSGIKQGRLIKRHRIPRDTDGAPIHFSDLNIGVEIPIYGKVFRIVDVDEFTREFLTSMGAEVGEPESMPDDAFSATRALVENREPRPKGSVRADPLKRFIEAGLGRPTHLLQDRDRFTKFLENDRKVLKFWCQWDASGGMYGALHHFVLMYYLADDTMQVIDLNKSDGKDPSATFIHRRRFPKAYQGIGDFGEREPREGVEFYTDADLRIGAMINVFGRPMLVNDCDDYTKSYLSEKYGITDFSPVYMPTPTEPEVPRLPPPPHNGIGFEEDSIQNCKRLVPKPPKKDVSKFLQNDKKVLRFSMKFAQPAPADVDREFILQFYLADDSISIIERKTRNSGRLEGQFLRRCRLRKNPPTDPVPQYYRPEEFIIGSEITILSHRFVITAADEFTLTYMEGNAETFRHSDVDEIARRLRSKLYEMRSKIRDTFRDMDSDKNGEIDIDEFTAVLRKFEFDLSDHEILSLFRRFDLDGSGTITYDEFVSEVLEQDFKYPGATPTVSVSPDAAALTHAEFANKVREARLSRQDERNLRMIIRNLRDIIFLKRALFTEALAEFDPTHRGVIEVPQFLAGVKKFGVQLNERELDMLVNHVYDSSTKAIPYTDFLSKLEYYGRGLDGPRH